MRLGELRGLCYEQINFQAGTLRVDRAYVQGEWTTPKNRKIRELAISRHLLVTLRAQRRWRRHPNSDLVFPSSVGTPLEVSHIDRDWEAMLKAANLDYRARHAMRHTHTTLQLQAGTPIARVAAAAGRSIAETEKTYYHGLPKAGGDDAEVLAGILATANGYQIRCSRDRTCRDTCVFPGGFQRLSTATNGREPAGRRAEIGRNLRFLAES